MSQMFLEYFPLIAKFISSKLDMNKTCFYMFKAPKPSEWTNFFFFQTSFFLPNVHHSFLKSEGILTLMTRREKGLELMKKNFITI